MKTLCLLALALLGASAAFAEGRLPPLFRYDPTVLLVPPRPPEVDKLEFRSRLDLERIERLDVGGSENPSWVDSSPVVVWGSELKKGLYVARIGNGHFALRLSNRKLIRYELVW